MAASLLLWSSLQTTGNDVTGKMSAARRFSAIEFGEEISPVDEHVIANTDRMFKVRQHCV